MVRIFSRQSIMMAAMVLILVFGGLLVCRAASKPYYEGKVITITVPSGAGAGDDLFCACSGHEPGQTYSRKPQHSHSEQCRWRRHGWL